MSSKLKWLLAAMVMTIATAGVILVCLPRLVEDGLSSIGGFDYERSASAEPVTESSCASPRAAHYTILARRMVTIDPDDRSTIFNSPFPIMRSRR